MHTITIYRSYYMPEDVYEGAIDYRSEECETIEYSTEWNAEYDSPVDWVLEEMNHLGYFEYSCYPFQPGGWWSADEVSGWDGNYTGARVDISIHLSGFSDEEQEQLYDAY